MIKELNNCISHLKVYVGRLEEENVGKEGARNKKEGLPPKYRKIALGNNTNNRKNS